MATVILAEKSSVLAKLAALASGARRVLRHARTRGYRPCIPARMLQHAGDSEACGTFTPEDGGPTAIVIGARAPMYSLRRLAARHNLEVDALALFARGE
ncbi:hypothetical protein [Caenimonas soli]|uniref:hypothetical protein n=1 Tax=Caenimonas soli TaxID=2735555 RepID=UPI001557D381|nr:hypothetical protein [Caenimonas soli]NPC57858.1 hypothetical protein [Caenimonas soli]